MVVVRLDLIVKGETQAHEPNPQDLQQESQSPSKLMAHGKFRTNG